MSFMDFLFGRGEKTKEFKRYTPEQEEVLNQLLGGGSAQLPQMFDYLQKILSQDPELMEQFEAPIKRQFEEEIIPSLGERFTALDAQRSSAFGQQAAEAGKRLSEGLSSQRAGLGFNAISQLQNLLGGGLSPRSELAYRPRQPGFLENIAYGAAPGIGRSFFGSLGLM